MVNVRSHCAQANRRLAWDGDGDEAEEECMAGSLRGSRMRTVRPPAGSGIRRVEERKSEDGTGCTWELLEGFARDSSVRSVGSCQWMRGECVPSLSGRRAMKL